MAEAQEDSEDVRRTRAIGKKKFGEEMEAHCHNISKAEEQLKNAGPNSLTDALKNLKAEKYASIEHRKKIDADLQKLNKDITEMMHSISRLQSTLHYRSEDRIDEAIRRLEWTMKVQNFKLSQEKKIVAEIDSLRRSKKTLMQYLNMKREKDTMRTRQRQMREERDYYFHKVTELKQEEEKLRASDAEQRIKFKQLKKELDRRYDAKRQAVTAFKRQSENFSDDHEKRKLDSSGRLVFQASERQKRDILEVQKQPYEDSICMCNTLIHYLQRFISNTDLESSSPGITLTSAPLAEESPSSGPAEELEDGQYVLLRKPEDDSYVTSSAKHTTRKQRRCRKQSLSKKITHTPEVLCQFMHLNLKAPITVAEILHSIQELRALKLQFEREVEVKSEAELSVTESSLLELSRQASHTESTDGMSDSRPSDVIIEQLLQLSVACDPDQPEFDNQVHCVDEQEQDCNKEKSFIASSEMNRPNSDIPSDECSSLSQSADSVYSLLQSEGYSFTALEEQNRFLSHARQSDLETELSECDRSDQVVEFPATSQGPVGGSNNDVLCTKNTSLTPGVCEMTSKAMSQNSDLCSSKGENKTQVSELSHICHAESSSKSFTAAPPPVWRVSNNKSTLKTSLQDFPPLVREKVNDVALVSLTDNSDHRGNKLRVQEKNCG